MAFRDLFPAPGAVIGMVHLLPLPGSPGWAGSMDAVFDRACADARTWAEAGADALMVENFGDEPFFPDAVEPHTVAAMALAVRAVREAAAGTPVGVNVLRNDACAAMGIAAASGARFIRVNVHAGAMLADQGILQGRAHETLRLRKALGADVLILADVMVKHAVPLAPMEIEDAARDTFHRGKADALVVSGAATGRPTDPEQLRRVRAAVPEAPLCVGSGTTAENVAALLRSADAVIAGTSAKVGGLPHNPVDLVRARALVAAAREVKG